MNNEQKSNCDGCKHYNADSLKKLGVEVADADFVVALAGNPNTGKSTVFNALTGLRQHTGNWPGKTVTRAEGGFGYSQKKYKVFQLSLGLFLAIYRWCRTPGDVRFIGALGCRIYWWQFVCMVIVGIVAISQ